jgi:hypothetical protein
MWTDGRTGMTKLIFAYRNFENALKIDVSRIKLGRYRNLFSANKRYDLPSLYTCLPLVHITVFVVVSRLCASNIDLNNAKKIVSTAKCCFPVSDIPPMLHTHI